MRQDSTQNVLWFLAGLTVGTAAGVMMAPKSGADARQLLASSGREYLDRGLDLFEKGKLLADEASSMYDEGRRLVEDAQAAEA